MSQIIFSVILGYYGGKGHRPRWIAIGVLFSAAACFLLAFPHLLYGAGEDALSLTEEYANILDNPSHKNSPLTNLTGKNIFMTHNSLFAPKQTDFVMTV